MHDMMELSGEAPINTIGKYENISKEAQLKRRVNSVNSVNLSI